ncbi:insulinase family protein [Gammaproteobacteria bacterium]|nr:insulinase family protein [Gammaproteobacteria bacterium]
MYVSYLLLLISSLVFAVEKSPLDDRQFDAYELDNGLKVLFVIDQNIKTASAAMRVSVGSSHDPKHQQGLAHFLEHMLFIGSEDYPDVDHLQSFVAHHGGHTNAFTGQDRTQYYFSVNPDYFETALDVFTSFFTAPTLDTVYVEREKHAVDSEFKMHVNNDHWRMYHLSNLTANPEHPYNRFTIGNLETLTDREVSLEEELRMFFETHYVGRNMCFVVVMPTENQAVLDHTLEKLNTIPRGKKTKESKVSYLSPEEEGRFIQMQSQTKDQRLIIDFPVYSEKSDYRDASLQYITHLLGDESPATLIDVLKQKHLIEEMFVSSNPVSDYEALVSFNIGLTEKGYAEIDQIIASINQGIMLAKIQGIEKWRFHEMQRIGMLSYLYQGQIDSVAQANYYVNALSLYEFEELNKAGHLTDIYQFNPVLIKGVLSQMQLKHARLMLASENVEPELEDPYFHVGYQISNLSDQQLHDLQQHSVEFILPEKNPYLPTQLKIGKGAIEDISVSQESQYLRFWQMYDDQFKLPKVYTTVRIAKQQHQDDKSRVALSVLIEMYRHQAIRSFYPAMKAGNQVVGYASEGDILVKSKRWSHSSALIPDMIKEMTVYTSNLIEQDFFQAKERLLREQSARVLWAPYLELESTLSEISTDRAMLNVQYTTILEQISFEDIQQIANQLWDDVSIEAFEYGNIIEGYSDLLGLSELVELKEGEFVLPTKSKVLQIEQSMQVAQSNHHNDIAVAHIYQTDLSIKNYVIAQLVSRLTQPGFFEDLRTQHQLGYIVYERFSPVQYSPFIKFVVQSPGHQCSVVESHINRYINTQSEWLERLADEDFDNVKSALLDEMMHSFTSMPEVYRYYESRIVMQTYDYDFKERVAQVLQGVSRQDVITFWNQYFVLSPNRLKMTLNCKDQSVLTNLLESKTSYQYQVASLAN